MRSVNIGDGKDGNNIGSFARDDSIAFVLQSMNLGAVIIQYPSPLFDKATKQSELWTIGNVLVKKRVLVLDSVHACLLGLAEALVLFRSVHFQRAPRERRTVLCDL